MSARCSGGRHCWGGGALAVLDQPPRLRIDAGHALAATAAPRAGERAGGAAEVRDHLAAAATGHTLPRLVSLLGSICAIGLLARHEAMRLASRR
jgi:hypothetical protein